MKFLYYILFSVCTFSVYAQVIPSNNRVEWDKAGCQYTFTEPQLVADVMNFGAHADGITDDMQAVVDAISSLNGRYGVVYFPSGTYLLQSGVSLPDSVVIRGAGSDSTFIKLNSTGSCFGVYGTSDGIFTDIVSGFNKDSEKITVDNIGIFSNGDYVEIRQENGSWDSNPATWATYSVGQITRVVSITGDTLFLEDKLRITFDTTLGLEIRKILPKKYISIECLNIERTDSSTSGTGYNFEFNLAVNCRVKGVESNKSQGSHCMINLGSHIEIKGCYFHDAYMYDGSGTKGYGVTLNCHSGLCLISDNIFKHLRHAMMTKHGANGNVFAYNYSIEVFRNGSGEFPADYGGDISLHGHYSFANLFEGNIVQNIHIDNYWGPSGPYNTFFRNRAEHYGIIMTTSQTNNQNFVGNEITGGSLPFGSYIITGTGNFEYGNNKNDTIIPSGTDTLNDLSYYLSAIPSFWDIPGNWPSIGIGNTFNTGSIPAKERYLAGTFTDCSNDIINSIQTYNKNDIHVYPNPVAGSSAITIELPENIGKHTVEVCDIYGKILKQESFYNINQGSVQFNLPGNIDKGIYVLRIYSQNAAYTKQLIKL
ncbi:MAG: glycosyl hydrolase family 28-related protein [Bacteroidales bacterium]